MLRNRLAEIEKTLGETFHSQLEGRTIEFLNALRKRDCRFYQDQSKALNFIYFLAHQMFRIPKFVGAAIFTQRDEYKFLFLENTTKIPFISGDQPVINLNTQNDKDLRLFYPLTPSVGLIYTKTDGQPTKTYHPSVIEIELYNHAIYQNSFDQIYANDRVYLEALSQQPKELF